MISEAMWLPQSTDLFADHAHQLNLLPEGGVLNDYGRVLPVAEANRAFGSLLNSVEWRPDEALIRESVIRTGREVAWYADKPYRYSHSGVERQAMPWAGQELAHIKSKIETLTGQNYNSCLINLYHCGDQGIGWHSDIEAMPPNDMIVSLSLGASRNFVLKHKATGARRHFMLEHGQVIAMHGETQRHWWHALLKTKQTVGARISLTFRRFPEKWGV